MKKDKFPDISFDVIIPRESIASKMYLGLFLALCLFVSYLFGNMFFFVIVALCVFFILLARDEHGPRKVEILKEGIVYGDDEYPYQGIQAFLFLENIFGNGQDYLRLSFKNYITPHVYIPIPGDVQKEILYAILSARLDESAAEPSFIEVLYLRFFS